MASRLHPASEPVGHAGSALAPGGTLRAGINLGNPVLAVRDPATGELRGVAIDIARELAARVDVPLRFVTYDSAARMAEEAPSGAWDVAFLGADPARETDITFTAPYLTLEATYLVPAGSRLQVPADVDAPGVRIAARPRSAYDLALRRIITRAQLVYPEGGETDVDLLATARADALASLRDVLVNTATSMPGSRVLDGHFATIAQAIGVPKGERAHPRISKTSSRRSRRTASLTTRFAVPGPVARRRRRNQNLKRLPFSLPFTF